MAVDTTGRPIALALATVGGAAGAHRFRPVVDSSMAKQLRNSADVGAVAGPGDSRTRFALHRVILREERPGDLTSFMIRRKGRLLSTRVLSARDETSRANTFITYHLVAVDSTTADVNGFAGLVERWTKAQGELRFSSKAALELLALVMEEQASGRFVELDVLFEPLAVPVTNEGTKGGDFFSKGQWFNPQSTGGDQLPRMGEGMSLARILVKPGMTSPVPLAIVDAGFAGPNDYAPPPFDNPDWGQPFNTIPQCSIDWAGFSTCGPGTAAGENSGGCDDPSQSLCKWHGTAVWSAGAAQLHNGFGSAGPGSQAATPILMKTDVNAYAVGSAVGEAMSPPSGAAAKIINLSLGIRCRLLGFDWLDVCDPLTNAILTGTSCTLLPLIFPLLSTYACPELAALAALATHIGVLHGAINSAYTSGGAVIVAGASNVDEDVDDASIHPCVSSHVVCISGLKVDAATKGVTVADNTGYGPSVLVWAPRTLFVTPVPPDSTSAPIVFDGNSGSAPLVSGALAVVRAIAPTLTNGEVVNVLVSSTCSSRHPRRMDGTNCAPSANGNVDGKGYLDFLELIRQARHRAKLDPLVPCTGGWDAAERLSKNDTAATALPLAPLAPTLHSTVSFTGDRDLSIHAFSSTLNSEEDWYAITFSPQQIGSQALGFLVEVRVPVQDPSLGRLIVDIFQKGPAGIKSVPPHSQVDSTDGFAVTQAIVRTDVVYFARVTAVFPVTRSANCYAGVSAKVLEHEPLPPIEP
ncbi:MAG TPA: S8/S53 family peptidase [Gemmatimonadales bacterium]|jgi:hypothetical protein